MNVRKTAAVTLLAVATLAPAMATAASADTVAASDRHASISARKVHKEGPFIGKRTCMEKLADYSWDHAIVKSCHGKHYPNNPSKSGWYFHWV